MKRNFNLHFYLKKPKNADIGKFPIYLRITLDKKRSECTTGRMAEEKEWSETGMMKGKTSKAKSFNDYLRHFEVLAYEAHRKLIVANEPVTAVSLRDKIIGKVPKGKTLVEVFQEHNDRMEILVGSEFAPMTLLRYQTSLRHLKQFIKLKYKAKDIELKDIGHRFVADYDFFLRSERKCANNSAVKYMKNFKKVIRISLAHGWINKDPFVNYKTTVKVVDRVFLDDAEILSLREKSFDIERLNLIRDVFLFSCYTGLAYVDVKKLKSEEIIHGKDGERWLVTKRQKTDVPTRVPLLPVASALIDQYQNHPLCADSGMALPVCSNVKMNAYLKEIADLCGIKKLLTFHIARHTFATTITLSNGVPIETVSKMLGHQSIKTTQHYAKILDKKVSEDMASLKEKLSNPQVSKTKPAFIYTISGK